MSEADPATKTVSFADGLLRDGFTQVPNGILMNSDLSLEARLVWATLAFYARQDETCWPGQLRLSGDLGLSERKLRMSIRELEAAELLETKQRGQGRTNLYRLLAPRPASRADQGDLDEDAGLDRHHVPIEEEAADEEAVKKIEQAQSKKLLDYVIEVWDHYVAVFDRPRMKLDSTRKTMIRNAIKAVGDGETEEEALRVGADLCKKAIEGLRVSPHHNGQNDQRQEYLDIRYALKGKSRDGESTEERIHKMAARAPGSGAALNSDSGLSDTRVRILVDEVEQALELNGNAAIVQRGSAAKRVLEEHGFVVKRDGLKVQLGRRSDG